MEFVDVIHPHKSARLLSSPRGAFEPFPSEIVGTNMETYAVSGTSILHAILSVPVIFISGRMVE